MIVGHAKEIEIASGLLLGRRKGMVQLLMELIEGIDWLFQNQLNIIEI